MKKNAYLFIILMLTISIQCPLVVESTSTEGTTTKDSLTLGTRISQTAGIQTTESNTVGIQTTVSNIAGEQTTVTNTAGVQTTASKTADTRASESNTKVTQTLASSIAGKQSTESNTAETKTTKSDTARTQTTVSDTTETHTTKSNTAGTKTTKSNTARTKTTKSNTAGTKTTKSNTARTQTTVYDTTETQSTESDKAGIQTTESHTTGTHTTESNTARTQATESNTAELQTTESDTARTQTNASPTVGTQAVSRITPFDVNKFFTKCTCPKSMKCVRYSNVCVPDQCLENNPCSEHGICIFDIYGSVSCRCKAETMYTYYGNHCQHRDTKIVYIIGGFALLFVIFIIVLLTICVKVRKMETKQSSKHIDSWDQTHKEYVEMQEGGKSTKWTDYDFSNDNVTDMKRLEHNPRYMFKDKEEFEDGRYYRMLPREKSGDESRTRIYQPTATDYPSPRSRYSQDTVITDVSFAGDDEKLYPDLNQIGESQSIQANQCQNWSNEYHGDEKLLGDPREDRAERKSFMIRQSQLGQSNYGYN